MRKRKRRKELERDSVNEFLFVWWLVIILPQHPLPFLSLLFSICIARLFSSQFYFIWFCNSCENMNTDDWINECSSEWMHSVSFEKAKDGIYLMKIPHLQIRQLVNNNKLRVLVIMTQLVDKTHSSHYSNGLANICLPVPSYLRCWVVSTACWKTNKEIQQQKTENWRLRTATHKTDAHKSLQSVI